MGFDIGAVLGNLVLSYASHLAHSPDAQRRDQYQEYLLQTVSEVWQGFATRVAEGPLATSLFALDLEAFEPTITASGFDGLVTALYVDLADPESQCAVGFDVRFGAR